MKSPSDSDSAAWGHTVVMSFSDAFWPAFWDAAHARRAADHLRRDIQGHCAEVATQIDEVRLEAEKYLATYRPKAGS
jgi:hypothetical protein